MIKRLILTCCFLFALLIQTNLAQQSFSIIPFAGLNITQEEPIGHYSGVVVSPGLSYQIGSYFTLGDRFEKRLGIGLGQASSILGTHDFSVIRDLEERSIVMSKDTGYIVANAPYLFVSGGLSYDIVKFQFIDIGLNASASYHLPIGQKQEIIGYSKGQNLKLLAYSSINVGASVEIKRLYIEFLYQLGFKSTRFEQPLKEFNRKGLVLNVGWIF